MIEQVGGAGRAYAPPELEEGEGEHGVVVELMGDWSWRPENQVRDPGYVFSSEEIARLNQCVDRREGTGHMPTVLLCLRSFAERPWMVPAYVGHPPRPVRINCIR